METARFLLLTLLCFSVTNAFAQQADPYWKNWMAEAEKAAPEYAELCKIWKKTDGVTNPKLSNHEIEVVRYWLTHQPSTGFDGNYPRMAAITAGNIRDAQSYDVLEKVYLNPNQKGEMVREEAFRAIAKIDPDRAAKYVIKELSSGSVSFAAYANIVLKEAYGTSFEQMKINMGKIYDRHDLD